VLSQQFPDLPSRSLIRGCWTVCLLSENGGVKGRASSLKNVGDFISSRTLGFPQPINSISSSSNLLCLHSFLPFKPIESRDGLFSLNISYNLPAFLAFFPVFPSVFVLQKVEPFSFGLFSFVLVS
jgi:hypothetical protein